MTVAQGRGRRPAGSGTKAAIEAAARRRFAELGYPRTTMRAIAQDAGVDPRLITHFFGSKQELFVAVVELPFDPEPTFDALLGAGGADLGARLADFILGMLEREETRRTITGIIRAAASEEEAAARIRDMLASRLLTPLARNVGADDPELRASLVASQVVGLTFARHVVGIPALQTADRDRLVQLLGRAFDVYLASP
ncbi:MAG: TetR family transcriptional regulator [Nocardioidaceae bacterium]